MADRVAGPTGGLAKQPVNRRGLLKYILLSVSALATAGGGADAHPRFPVAAQTSSPATTTTTVTACGACHAPGTEIAERVKAMYTIMEESNVAYEEAEGVIAQAAGLRLIIAEQEEMLQRARTPLIER